jgi:hypothetical protein
MGGISLDQLRVTTAAEGGSCFGHYDHSHRSSSSQTLCAERRASRLRRETSRRRRRDGFQEKKKVLVEQKLWHLRSLPTAR